MLFFNTRSANSNPLLYQPGVNKTTVHAGNVVGITKSGGNQWKSPVRREEKQVFRHGHSQAVCERELPAIVRTPADMDTKMPIDNRTTAAEIGFPTDGIHHCRRARSSSKEQAEMLAVVCILSPNGSALTSSHSSCHIRLTVAGIPPTLRLKRWPMNKRC